jgi:hypothetical protein
MRLAADKYLMKFDSNYRPKATESQFSTPAFSIFLPVPDLGLAADSAVQIFSGRLTKNWPKIGWRCGLLRGLSLTHA